MTTGRINQVTQYPVRGGGHQANFPEEWPISRWRRPLRKRPPSQSLVPRIYPAGGQGDAERVAETPPGAVKPPRSTLPDTPLRGPAHRTVKLKQG